MGEAKRRKAWVAKGGKDWGVTGYSGRSRWAARVHGKTAEEIKLLENQRDARRGEQKSRIFGALGMASMAIGLSKSAISRLSAARAQMKKRGASSAARRAFR